MTANKRNLGRWVVGLALALGLGLLYETPANAHIEVTADNATAGASNVRLSFEVEGERSTATTNAVSIYIPNSLAGTTVQPVAVDGWNAETSTADGNQMVTWSGGNIAVSGSGTFPLIVGQLPEGVPSLEFKVLQTYSNGEVVRWIDVQSASGAEPEFPAPVLTLTASATTSTTPTAVSTTTTTTVQSTTEKETRSDSHVAVAVAVALGFVALIVLSVIFLKRRRST